MTGKCMKKIAVSIIAAIDEQRGMGKKNDLLFRIPEDLKRFREKTSGHPVIMGRKTFDSLHMPNGLPNRTNIVLTKDNDFEVIINETGGVFAYQKLETALGQARHIAQQKGLDEVFIIGGGQVFKQALKENLVDRLYLTIVKGNYDADTFFPEYEQLGFRVVKEDPKESDDYQYTFLDLEK